MKSIISRSGLVLILALALVGPSLAMSSGPPWTNANGDPTITHGCTCHGGGSPSSSLILAISGVPQSYEPSTTYNFTIHLETSTSSSGGFLLWDSGAGTFDTSANGLRAADGEPSAISQSSPGNDWVVGWTAPAEDGGDISFQLVGNAVDDSGNADEGDEWNILSFMISAPGTATDSTGDELGLRTIAVGDYDSLFVADESPEALEEEHQAELANAYFENGNLYYWATLAILIIGAVVQGEFYERKYGGGPTHLDMSLAVPQGIRRSILALLALYVCITFYEGDWGYGWVGVTAMVALWAAFGVYRTIVQAKAPVSVPDML